MDGERLEGTHEGICFTRCERLFTDNYEQVWLPAIEGYVPKDMIHAISAFLDFCYLVRRPTITQKTLTGIQDALDRFHHYRPIFQKTGVREPGPKGFSLPRQHALKHYIEHVVAFGAPNGLCSSITESMHIRAVKKPWRRSSRLKALDQILLTNQRLSKLAAIRRSFENCGMLQDDCHTSALKEVGLATLDSEPSPDAMNEVADELRDCGPVEGPQVLNHVVLARRKGGSQSISSYSAANYPL